MRATTIPQSVLAAMPGHLANHLIGVDGVEFYPDGSYRVTDERIQPGQHFGNRVAALRYLAVIVGPGAYRLEREQTAAPLAQAHQMAYADPRVNGGFHPTRT